MTEFNFNRLIAGDAIQENTKSYKLKMGPGVLKRGQVLGLILEAEDSIYPAENVGDGTVTSAIAKEPTKTGNYVVRMLTATTFDVVNPDGEDITAGAALGAYSDDEIGFTITAGGTPFAAGDFIIIPMTPVGAVPAKATNTDSSKIPAVILVDDVDTSLADTFVPCYISGVFDSKILIYDETYTEEYIIEVFRSKLCIVKITQESFSPS